MKHPPILMRQTFALDGVVHLSTELSFEHPQVAGTTGHYAFLAGCGLRHEFDTTVTTPLVVTTEPRGVTCSACKGDWLAVPS